MIGAELDLSECQVFLAEFKSIALAAESLVADSQISVSR